MHTAGEKETQELPGADGEPNAFPPTMTTPNVDANMQEAFQATQNVVEGLGQRQGDRHEASTPLEVEGTRPLSYTDELLWTPQHSQQTQQPTNEKDNRCGSAAPNFCLQQSSKQDLSKSQEPLLQGAQTRPPEGTAGNWDIELPEAGEVHQSNMAASLEMYEARLEEARGRSCELTEYLMQLKDRTDEVRVNAI
jgi:hypothetical protein